MAATQSQTNKGDEISPQTQTAAPRDIETTAYDTSISVAECPNCVGYGPPAQRHVHWANGIPLQCQNETHSHLYKMKSPPPKPCDEIAPEMAEEGHSLLAKVTKMHPIVSLEAKGKDLLHSKHLHSEKPQNHDKSGS
jgi:hypothetical protein